jgi:hypothetical protein
MDCYRAATRKRGAAQANPQSPTRALTSTGVPRLIIIVLLPSPTSSAAFALVRVRHAPGSDGPPAIDWRNSPARHVAHEPVARVVRGALVSPGLAGPGVAAETPSRILRAPAGPAAGPWMQARVTVAATIALTVATYLHVVFGELAPARSRSITRRPSQVACPAHSRSPGHTVQLAAERPDRVPAGSSESAAT